MNAISHLRMWNFIKRAFGRGIAAEPEPTQSTPSQVSTMLEAIDDGKSQLAPPTLVCRKCGLKYNNIGTYLSGSQCPDCAAPRDSERASSAV